jgi:hypothetical protein
VHKDWFGGVEDYQSLVGVPAHVPLLRGFQIVSKKEIHSLASRVVKPRYDVCVPIYMSSGRLCK